MVIVLHKEDCPDIPEHSLHVKVKKMDDLVDEVFSLMQKYKIPFHHVEPHNRNCPGLKFPLEELEHKLFILEH
ncbi:MAG: hypothetical protein KGZ63_11060 [Clostridiales bacterium]|jgi:hypothetical protein|nr:hypothetical protein [Clostridiales bacterium]